MKNQYLLMCFAPDGANQEESGCGRDGFPEISEAWKHSEDMGSRWYFYPIHLVTTSGPAIRRRVIRDVPHGVPSAWIGKTVGTFCEALSSFPELVDDYLQGLTPLCIEPVQLA